VNVSDFENTSRGAKRPVVIASTQFARHIVTKKCVLLYAMYAALFLSLGLYLYGGVENSSRKAIPKAVRPLAYRSLSSGADLHYRSKWSNDVFLYIDDDLVICV
jgi:hypothetical protein